MTKQEFLELQTEVSSSERTLKSILTVHEVSYSTYHYWRHKFSSEESLLPMAPIAIKESVPPVGSNMNPVVLLWPFPMGFVLILTAAVNGC